VAQVELLVERASAELQQSKQQTQSQISAIDSQIAQLEQQIARLSESKQVLYRELQKDEALIEKYRQQHRP
jgi:septal ring factor EnvC (AmiA/AmiB activator)